MRKRSLHTTMAMPAIRPMVTRPAGPIQLLSKANFRKYEIPINSAVMPMRLSQCDPMRDSRSGWGAWAATVRRGEGGGGGTRGYGGWTGAAAVGGRPSAAGCAGGAVACGGASISRRCSMREMRVVSSARMRRIASRSLWDGSIGTGDYRRKKAGLHVNFDLGGGST